MLHICEIFKSIQGESTYAGLPCSFVRLVGCNLRCSYCDTTYAFTDGYDLPIQEIVTRVQAHGTTLAEITGGEPLMQEKTAALCARLLEHGFTVLIETNGSRDISTLPAECVRIIDIKCPGSGQAGSFLGSNYDQLRSTDELKFVISHAEDFRWAHHLVRTRQLDKQCVVIFSPNTRQLAPETLASWILQENAPVRLGLQLHKIIWGERRGV